MKLAHLANILSSILSISISGMRNWKQGKTVQNYKTYMKTETQRFSMVKNGPKTEAKQCKSSGAHKARRGKGPTSLPAKGCGQMGQVWFGQPTGTAEPGQRWLAPIFPAKILPRKASAVEVELAPRSPWNRLSTPI